MQIRVVSAWLFLRSTLLSGKNSATSLIAEKRENKIIRCGG